MILMPLTCKVNTEVEWGIEFPSGAIYEVNNATDLQKLQLIEVINSILANNGRFDHANDECNLQLTTASRIFILPLETWWQDLLRSSK